LYLQVLFCILQVLFCVRGWWEDDTGVPCSQELSEKFWSTLPSKCRCRFEKDGNTLLDIELYFTCYVRWREVENCDRQRLNTETHETWLKWCFVVFWHWHCRLGKRGRAVSFLWPWQVSHNTSCTERKSCHRLVRCQNLGRRRTSENQAGLRSRSRSGSGKNQTAWTEMEGHTGYR